MTIWGGGSRGATNIFKHTFFGRGSSFVIVNSEGGKRSISLVTIAYETVIRHLYFYSSFLYFWYSITDMLAPYNIQPDYNYNKFTVVIEIKSQWTTS